MEDGSELHVRVVEVDSACAIVYVKGDVDVFTVDRFRAPLQALVDRGFRDLVLDLSQAGHFDSSAMGAALSVNVRLAALGGVLRLASLPERIQRLFELTHFGDVLAVYPSVEAAMASLGRVGPGAVGAGLA